MLEEYPLIAPVIVSPVLFLLASQPYVYVPTAALLIASGRLSPVMYVRVTTSPFPSVSEVNRPPLSYDRESIFTPPRAIVESRFRESYVRATTAGWHRLGRSGPYRCGAARRGLL